MHVAKIVIISLVVFVLVTIIVTGALQDRIFFSLFVGIPFGLVAFVLSFIYMYRQKNE
ncbi:hypothetical protein [Methanolobus sp. WCC5]|jgi:hypothetical protein|uniref:hypothetical protein n=1 Tax=Methanolobus sp. WCC5 TaxID=3125785 RepID=UPI003243F3B7